MNHLVYIKNNYNVISACFVRNKKISSQLYNWYLPYCYSDKVYVNEDIKVKINQHIKTVRIINLTYHPSAESLYKPFPILKNQPSWQVRYICRLLELKGFQYDRERCFKGLKNIDGKPLRIDISFIKDDQWHFVEYHGIHHYYKLQSTLRRFNNVRRIMEIKRDWCFENSIPYLEIPFFKQNEIEKELNLFLNDTTK